MTPDTDLLTSPEGRLAYAAAQEDQITGADPEAHTWLFVPALSLDAVGGPARWQTFWDEVQTECRERGVAFWDELPTAVIAGQVPPIVVALVVDGNESEEAWPNVWDGQHRLGAAAISEVPTVAAVIGLPKELTWAQVPAAWRALAPVQAHFTDHAPRPRRRAP